MESTLNEDLCASELDCLLNLLENFFSLQKIRFMVVLASPKGAEPAAVDADICVIDIPVYNKSNNALRMQIFSRAVGHPAEFKEITLPEQPQSLFSCNAVIVLHFQLFTSLIALQNND